MFSFIDYLNSLDVPQLKECLTFVQETIAVRLNRSNSILVDPVELDNAHINDYVTYDKSFVSDNEKNVIMDEIQSLSIGKNSKPEKVSNKWLSYVNEPYSWNSADGTVVLDPNDLRNFPHIVSLLNRVNSSFNCDLNSVLISRYKSGNACIRAHDDDEDSLDSSQPICVVSLGATRRIEFVKKNDDLRKTSLAIHPVDGSVYSMLPGCQSYFLHRVRRNKNIRKERYILSFRKFIPEAKRKRSTTILHTTPEMLYNSPSVTSPVKNLVQHFNRSAAHSTPKPVEQAVAVKNTKQPTKLTPPSFHDNTRQGYSPFLDSTSTTKGGETSKSSTTNNSKVCVIFGHSITKGIVEELMSKQSRKVINCSYSGANVWDLREAVRDFCLDYPGVVHRVDKVLVCIGTNDVKNFDCNRFDVHTKFRKPLVDIVKQIKLLLPSAQIIFKCVLPMGILYNYTAKCVHEFNHLLLEICGSYNCIFFDCFSDFLDRWGIYNDSYLYRDRIHLNDIGLRKLCRAMKFIIHKNVFNPITRISPSRYFYLDW